MPIQSGTFKRLPPKEDIFKAIEREKEHNADLVTFALYIGPVAEKAGRRVYEVAAAALTKDGLPVTAQELEALVAELKTPSGQKKHAEQIKYHLFGHVTG
jgi:hypothetical protein